MSIRYLRQLLTNINKVYDIGEKINSIKDKRVKSPVNISTITFVVIFFIVLHKRKLFMMHWQSQNWLSNIMNQKH